MDLAVILVASARAVRQFSVRQSARLEFPRRSVLAVTGDQVAGKLHRIREHRRAAEALVELGAVPSAVWPTYLDADKLSGSADRAKECGLLAWPHTVQAYSTGLAVHGDSAPDKAMNDPLSSRSIVYKGKMLCFQVHSC